MLRSLLLAIALMLPVQFAWAGMSALCQHETDPVKAQHIGHHDHHQGDKRAPSGGKSIVGDSCGSCHGYVVALLSVDQAVPGIVVTSMRIAMPGVVGPPSVPSRTPDRPQWLRLA